MEKTTKEEVKSLVDGFGKDCTAAEFHFQRGEIQDSREHAKKAAEQYATLSAALDALFASLAVWDAVIQECLPGLQAEYEALKSLKQGTNNEWEYECAVNDQRSDAGYSALPHKYISPTGLARLEYLRGILGEEAP